MTAPGRARQERIYREGVSGARPRVPTGPDELERRARRAMSRRADAYVTGGAGAETTMRANRAFRLTVARSGRGVRPPCTRVEVVSVDDGEPVLYWELAPREAARLVRELRADLAGMQAAEFIALWEGADER